MPPDVKKAKNAPILNLQEGKDIVRLDWLQDTDDNTYSNKSDDNSGNDKGDDDDVNNKDAGNAFLEGQLKVLGTATIALHQPSNDTPATKSLNLSCHHQHQHNQQSMHQAKSLEQQINNEQFCE